MSFALQKSYTQHNHLFRHSLAEFPTNKEEEQMVCVPSISSTASFAFEDLLNYALELCCGSEEALELRHSLRAASIAAHVRQTRNKTDTYFWLRSNLVYFALFSRQKLRGLTRFDQLRIPGEDHAVTVASSFRLETTLVQGQSSLLIFVLSPPKKSALFLLKKVENVQHRKRVR
jgi:hypothetical protein